jgi:stage V sporulation protein AE
MKRRIIIVTDGDKIAERAVETAAKNIDGRCISLSGGNPTELEGSEIVKLIKDAKYDPVVVMVDDRGDNGIGNGEKAMEVIINNENIELMGIVAVASNTPNARGVKVDCSIDKFGNITKKAVDKYGNEKDNKILKGDTVNTLSEANVPFVVGLGDPGKMDGNDNIEIGAPIITRAMEEIIKNYEERLKKYPKNIER